MSNRNTLTDVLDNENWLMIIFGKNKNLRKNIDVKRVWKDKQVTISKGGSKPRFYFVVRRKDKIQ